MAVNPPTETNISLADSVRRHRRRREATVDPTCINLKERFGRRLLYEGSATPERQDATGSVGHAGCDASQGQLTLVSSGSGRQEAG
jgi:hypothetical protein